MSEQKTVKKQESHALIPEVKKHNIDGLPDLAREFASGRMVEKKTIALRRKLIEVFIAGKATEEEQSLMESILRRERGLGVINSSDNYLLNKIEADRCEEKCVVKTQNPPQVHHMVTGVECKFSRDLDKNKFIVYVPRIVPPEHQMTVELIMKEHRGHFASEDEYPKPKTLIHRIILSQKEFNAWLEIVDEDILNRPSTAPGQETYVF